MRVDEQRIVFLVGIGQPPQLHAGRIKDESDGAERGMNVRLARLIKKLIREPLSFTQRPSILNQALCAVVASGSSRPSRTPLSARQSMRF